MNSQLTLFVVALLIFTSVTVHAQVDVVSDDFEAGNFSPNWTTTSGTGTRVVHQPGGAEGGSDYFARIEGVSGSGGLGMSLVGLNPDSPFATDFDLSFDFRPDATSGGVRQFSLIGSAVSATPGTNATLNLRYQDGEWAGYDGAWQRIPSLAGVTPGTWNHVKITGKNWGTGQTGAATFDVAVTDHVGHTSSATGLQYWQHGNPDADGIKSLSLNDIWGNNPGFDVDNVTITATPAPSPPATTTITPTDPIAYSGIYPHTAVANNSNESGVGGIINRSGKLFMMTYPPHAASGSGADKLYRVDMADLSQTTYHQYPGGTHANRYRDSQLGIDVIGAAYIDARDSVRYLPLGNGAGRLGGRITGTSPHLSDPDKLYYFTMEEGLYEVDYSDLAAPVITQLKADRNFDASGSTDLPGVHAKGLYTSQNRMYFTNNGAGSGGAGLLAEWDGVADPNIASSWRIVDQDAQYTEVTSRHGPADVDPHTTDAVWALGWDDASVILNVREAASGEWTKFRLPKASYTHGHPNGWYTEWPRIRDVRLEQGRLMSHHGMMFTIPETFAVSDPSGIQVLGTHHKMIVDYVEHGDQIVMATNDSTRFSNALVPKANSNVMFVDKAKLRDYGGTPAGFGGVAVNRTLAGNQVSDAFFVDGFRHRVVHFEHENSGPAEFTIEADLAGDGNWTTHDTVTIEGNSGKGYGYYLLPRELQTQWIRIRTQQNVTSATAYLHLANRPRSVDEALLSSVADNSAPTARSQGLLRSMNTTDYQLEFAADILDAAGNATGTGYYRAQLNPTTYQLELVAVNDPASEAALRTEAATTHDFGVDEASAYIDDGGVRYRLPKGHAAFDSVTASGWRRGVREVVTERSLMNVHGTIYELPREFDGGGIRRIRPMTTHNRDIFDFASWRGMLVLSGNELDAVEDGHYVKADDGRVGLWFGNVDDLWSFGGPAGVGGPWNNSAVVAGEPSDPYLMTGYEEKLLELSHSASSPVEFTLEVDFLGTGQWEKFGTLVVAPGATLSYRFEEGYSAHWIRLISDTTAQATAWFTYSISLSGDFDGDGQYGCTDVDALVAEIVAGGHAATFDLTGDGLVDRADLDLWLTEAGAYNLASGAAYRYGDANLDGVVDVSDFNLWNVNKFIEIAAWCSGDFNADGVVDASDFNLWNANKFTGADRIDTVPEPFVLSHCLIWLALVAVRSIADDRFAALTLTL